MSSALALGTPNHFHKSTPLIALQWRESYCNIYAVFESLVLLQPPYRAIVTMLLRSSYRAKVLGNSPIAVSVRCCCRWTCNSHLLRRRHMSYCGVWIPPYVPLGIGLFVGIGTVCSFQCSFQFVGAWLGGFLESPSLVLKYLSYQWIYQHETCSTCPGINFTTCVQGKATPPMGWSEMTTEWWHFRPILMPNKVVRESLYWTLYLFSAKPTFFA